MAKDTITKGKGEFDAEIIAALSQECALRKTSYLETGLLLRKGERMLLQGKYCATLGLMNGAEVEIVHIQLADDDYDNTENDTAAIQVLRYMPVRIIVRALQAKWILPDEYLPGIPDEWNKRGLFEVKPETKYFQIVHKGLKIKVNRTQVPLISATTKIVYGAQGETWKAVIGDLQIPPRMDPYTFWLCIYVVITRATSLEGLLLLRLPSRDSLSAGPPKHLQNEMKKLTKMGDKTIKKLKHELRKLTGGEIPKDIEELWTEQNDDDDKEDWKRMEHLLLEVLQSQKNERIKLNFDTKDKANALTRMPSTVPIKRIKRKTNPWQRENENLHSDNQKSPPKEKETNTSSNPKEEKRAKKDSVDETSQREEVNPYFVKQKRPSKESKTKNSSNPEGVKRTKNDIMDRSLKICALRPTIRTEEQCFINATITAVFSCPTIADTLQQLDMLMATTHERELKETLNDATAELQEHTAYTPHRIWQRYYRGRQEDAQEFLQKLLNDEDYPTLNKLFIGNNHPRLHCAQAGCTWSRAVGGEENNFTSIIVDITDRASLQEALDAYWNDKIVVELEDWVCGNCFNQDKPYIRNCMTEAPTMLCICMKRYYFDCNEEPQKNFCEVLCNNEIRMKDLTYRLDAVIVHQGRWTDTGHYFTYVRGSLNWLLYNDDTISFRSYGFRDNDEDTGYICLYQKVS